MPEGHTIHRAARLQSRRFGGEALRVWSPQGRFVEEASVLDGQTLETVDALGKHLFYRWENAPTVHVHLGLFGKFKIGPKIEPSQNARFAWQSETHILSLSGPTICEFMDPADEEALRARLGPDPLSPKADDVERLRRSLSRRSIPIGAALLDQAVVAGVGNVYRAELLFLAGLDPETPSKRLGPDQVEGLWKLITEQLEIGERIGRIVTVDPVDVDAQKLREVPRGSRTYVYKRKGQPCRRCGTPIRSTNMGSRTIWWCPVCQPSHRDR